MTYTPHHTNRTIRYSTATLLAAAVTGLIPIHSAAQCVINGNALDCSGTFTTTNIDINAPIDTVNIAASANINNTAFSDLFRTFSDATVNNAGTVSNDSVRNLTSSIAGFTSASNLIVNNNATGVVRVAGTGVGNVAVGADDNNLSRLGSLSLTNEGLIQASGNAFSVAGGNSIDTLANLTGGNISGRIILHADDDTLTNAGTITAPDIDLGAGNDTLSNDSPGVIDTNEIRFGTGSNTFNNALGAAVNITATSGPAQVRVGSTQDLTVNNDGDIILNGSFNNADVIFNLNGALVVNNTGNIRNNIGLGGGNFAIVDVGTSLDLTNSGTVFSSRGGIFSLTTSNITNQAGGVITGDSQFGNGDDTVTNAGEINARTLNFRGGTNILNNTSSGVINLDGSTGNIQDRISDSGGAFVLNNDGDIILTGTTTNFDVFHIRGSLTVNNTGLVENRIATAATPTGTDVFVNVIGGTTNITNSGRIIAPTGQRAIFHTVNSTATIDNQSGGEIQGIIALDSANDTITNAGIISGNLLFAAGNDTLTNNAGGTINATAILPGTGNDTITNNGTITGMPALNASADGLIELTSGADRITNNVGGLIEATGPDRAAIRVQRTGATPAADAIVNAGTIRATAEALFITGSNTDLTGGITNLSTGQIIGDSDNTPINERASGTGDATIWLRGGANLSGGLNNAGLIEHNTITAVLLESFGTQIPGLIENSGTIRGAIGGISVSGVDLAAGIENSGSIIGTSSVGIAVNTTGTDISGGINNLAGGVISGGLNGVVVGSSSNDISGGITNAGTISGTGATGVGITVNGGSNDISGGVNNQSGGVISGNTGIRVEGGLAISGGIVNAGTIQGTGGTAIRLDGLSQATPITLAAGRIVGDVTDGNAAAGRSPVTVTGSGLRTEGNFTVSDLVVNAGQDFTIRAGDTINLDTQSNSPGTLRFEIGQSSDARLNVTGTGQGINLTGATVEATLDPNRALTDGAEILIGTGNAPVVGLTGTTGQAVTDITDDSALFDFAVADGGQAEILADNDNSNLFLLATRLATAAETAQTPNAQRAGATVDALDGTTDPQLVALVNQAALAPTPEALENLLQSVLPDIDRSALDVASQLTNHTVRLVSDRLTVIREHDGSLAPERLTTISHHAGPAEPVADDEHNTFQPWAQVFGQRVDREFSDTVEGFDATSFGFSVGLDTGELSETAVAGLAFSYSDTDVQSQSINRTESDIDSFNVTLYGDYDLDDASYLAGDVGLTFSQHEATRFDVAGVAGQNAQADFDSLQFSARLIAARELLLNDEWILTPKALVRYVRFDADSFTETGAGGASLSVSDTSADILEVGAIVDLRKQFTLDDGALLSTDVSVGYRYDLIGEAIETTSSFVGGGPTFVSQGADPDQGTLNLGAGVGYTAPDRWELTLNYDYELRGDTQSHAGNLRLAIPF